MWDEGQAGGDGGGATRGRIVCRWCCHERGLPLGKQNNQTPHGKSGASLQCKDKPTPEQHTYKERCVDNEILQMLVEGMVGHREQGPRTDGIKHQAANEDTLTQGEKQGAGASNKQRPATATARHLPRALA